MDILSIFKVVSIGSSIASTSICSYLLIKVLRMQRALNTTAPYCQICIGTGKISSEEICPGCNGTKYERE